MHLPSRLAPVAASVISISAVSCSTTLYARDSINDNAMLNYASTLKDLEDAYYTQSLDSFTSGPSDEVSHQTADVPATRPRMYSFPVVSPDDFVFYSGILDAMGRLSHLGPNDKLPRV